MVQDSCVDMQGLPKRSLLRTKTVVSPMPGKRETVRICVLCSVEVHTCQK